MMSRISRSIRREVSFAICCWVTAWPRKTSASFFGSVFQEAKPRARRIGPIRTEHERLKAD
jgi:hypothetical protein